MQILAQRYAMLNIWVRHYKFIPAIKSNLQLDLKTGTAAVNALNSKNKFR